MGFEQKRIILNKKPSRKEAYMNGFPYSDCTAIAMHITKKDQKIGIYSEEVQKKLASSNCQQCYCL